MTQSQTHFELFNLPVSFEVELKDLSQRYRDLQRVAHPDRFTNASDQEKMLSMQQATTINDAYQILKSPQKRARYMLELQSVSFDDEKDTALDPMFLMEQIELRESLEDLGQGSDAMGNLNKIMVDIKNRITSVVAEIKQLLENPKLSDEQKTQAKQSVHKMQFLNKLQEEAEYQEERLLDTI
ncbi:MAG: Fe-S protein assembly co-chaperone HscB [Woeseiaceae bacterium]